MGQTIPTPEQAEEALHLTPLPDTAPWWAKYLVANWKQIYRYASTWFLAALAAVPLAQEALPTLQLDQHWDHALTVLFAVLTICARVVKQTPPTKE